MPSLPCSSAVDSLVVLRSYPSSATLDAPFPAVPPPEKVSPRAARGFSSKTHASSPPAHLLSQRETCPAGRAAPASVIRTASVHPNSAFSCHRRSNRIRPAKSAPAHPFHQEVFPPRNLHRAERLR